MTPFSLEGPLPSGRTVLEASAGTGKTYSLTGLIVRFIAEQGVPADQFLVVTFTRAAANELRDRTRSALDAAAAALRDGAPPASHPWMSVLLDTPDPAVDRAAELTRRVRRIDEARTRFDDLNITTIHGFCQQALTQLGFRSGIDPDAVLVESVQDVLSEVCRDEIIAELADHPTALDTPGASSNRVETPQLAESELKRAVSVLMSNPGAGTEPRTPTDPVANRWLAVIERTHAAVAERQRARNEIGYDALISGLHSALLHPEHGDTVARQLAQRSAVILVDEFQDTDRMQWEVFDRAFADRILITVGDPKQAIYRFRGADVHAYLDAVGGATALGLGTNHRSDRAVLSGLACLFDGATLGDRRIPFVAVQPRPDAPQSALVRRDGTNRAEPAEPAVQLRMVPVVDSLRTANGHGLAMPLVRSLILSDLVGRVIDLLDHGAIDDDAGSAAAAPVRPGDIAVLVPSHAEAANVAAALRRARVPAVRTRTGSVLETPAAEQWRVLLAALAQPHQSALVRAAALGWFLRTDVLALANDDTVLSELEARTAELAERMRTVGVSAFYDEQKARTGTGDLAAGLAETVLGRDGGDRDLTDLDHISELLAGALQGRNNGNDPAQVLRVLEQLISDTEQRSEAAMRRIDSDALAVQITTIHSAKGLEFPIVLVPFGFKPRANLSTPYAYTSPSGQRMFDLASKVGWDSGPSVPGDETTRNNQELRRHLATLDVEGDELRLLYVALTRAKHRLEIWWASTRGAGTSALGRILTDRNGAGPVRNSEHNLTPKKRGTGFTVHKLPYLELTGVDATAQIQRLTRESGGAIACIELDAEIPPIEWAGYTQPSIHPLAIASSQARTRVVEPNWKRWSFTRLDSAVAADTRDRPAAGREEIIGDARIDRGGFDEGDDGDEGNEGDVPETISHPARTDNADQQLALGLGPTAHLANVVGGTGFGTFVHTVLEQLDCTSTDLHGDIGALVAEHATRSGLRLDTAAVVDGLVAAVRTPLGPLFGDHTLADIAPRDRLAELTFDLPIVAAGGSVPAGAIGEILLRHLPPDDLVRPFAGMLANDFARVDIAGWMHGSIDAVLRVAVDGMQRYLVVDYKTNKLHRPDASDPVAAYHPTLLVAAMEHSRYPLQALLYVVAVHRYLRWRLGAAYVPDQHLGGTAYLFVRGMVGPHTPTTDGVAHGVFSWRPAVAAVLAIDELFATGAQR